MPVDYNLALKVAIMQSRWRTQVRFAGAVRGALRRERYRFTFDQVRLSKIIHGDVPTRGPEQRIIAALLDKPKTELFK